MSSLQAERAPTHQNRRPVAAPAVAEWVGLAFVVYVLGSGLLRMLTNLGDPTGTSPLIGSLQHTAIAGTLSAAVILTARTRPARPVVLLACLLGVWLGAATLSAWVLTGDVLPRPVYLGLTCFSLMLAAAAGRPGRTGWAVLAIGTATVYANLYVIWRNYATVGEEFGPAARWRVEPGEPVDFVQWLWLAMRDDIWGYNPVGLTRNPNLTGNFVAFLIVFTLPFAVSRWRGAGATRAHAIARVTLVAACTVPGFVLLAVLQARGALVGVLLGWAVMLLPLAWSRTRAIAWVAAAAFPLALLVPVGLALLDVVGLSGRDCVWRSWFEAVSAHPLWGLGWPGRFPSVACEGPRWLHAHNDLLQALSLGGVLGLAAAIACLCGLAWYAVRYSDRDQRCLLVLLTCAVILMGMEVIAVLVARNWISPGMAAFVVIAGRSMALITDRGRDANASGG